MTTTTLNNTGDGLCKDLYELYKSAKRLQKFGGDPGLILILGHLLDFGSSLTIGLARGVRRDRISRIKRAIQLLLPSHKDAVAHLLELIFGSFSKCDFTTSLEEEARVKLAIELLVRMHEQVELGVESDYILVANCLCNKMRAVRVVVSHEQWRFSALLKRYGVANVRQEYISFRECHHERGDRISTADLRIAAIYLLMDQKYKWATRVVLSRLRQSDSIRGSK